MYDFIDLVRLEANEPMESIKVAQQLHLIPPSDDGPTCNTKLCTKPPMVLSASKTQLDGYEWICSGEILLQHNKKRKCSEKRSIRKDTIFSTCHLPMWQILLFLYSWCQRTLLLKDINNLCRVESSTAADLALLCCNVISQHLIRNGKKIGGEGQVVEVDKWMFNENNRRGNSSFFGGLDRTSGRVFIAPVSHPCSESLLLVIKHWIEPGTTIVSECWKLYDCPKNNGFKKLSDEEGFVFKDSEVGNSIHGIKSTWSHARESFSTLSTDFVRESLPKYVFWKSCLVRDMNQLTEFCNLAGRIYNGKCPADDIVNERTAAYDKLVQDLNEINEGQSTKKAVNGARDSCK